MSAAEIEDVEDPKRKRVVDGIRFNVRASHWRLARLRDGEAPETMAHGKNEIGEVMSEWPIEQFSLATIREWFGSGTYEARFIAYNDSGKRVILGRSRSFAVAAPERAVAPANDPAPPAPTACASCGEALVPRARVCPYCATPIGGAAVPAARGNPFEFIMQGVTFANEVNAAALARAEHEQRLRLERERNEHDRDLERLRARHDLELREADERRRQREAREQADAQGGALATVVEQAIARATAPLRERIDELQEQLEEEDDDAQGEAPAGIANAVATVNALAPLIKEVGPTAIEILGKMAEAFAKGVAEKGGTGAGGGNAGG